MSLTKIHHLCPYKGNFYTGHNIAESAPYIKIQPTQFGKRSLEGRVVSFESKDEFHAQVLKQSETIDTYQPIFFDQRSRWIEYVL